MKLRKPLLIIAFVAFMVTFFSCATTKTAGEKGVQTVQVSASTKQVYVTNSKKVHLLMPQYMSGFWDSLQLLSGTYGNSRFSLLVYSQLDADSVSLSLMNDFGTDMGSVFYDGEKVVFDSAYFPDMLPGEYIICDIQNAFYDESALAINYANAKLTFKVTENTRQILDGNKLIEQVLFEDGKITITNYLRGYEFQLVGAE